MKIHRIANLLLRELDLFAVGGFIYYMIECAARGYSHWTMFVVGGMCFVIIGLLNEWYNEDMLFEVQTLIGSFVITALEFISGYILNIILHLNIWDYSQHMFNLYGQICLHHCIFYWIPLSAIAIVMDDYIRHLFFFEKKPSYHFLFQKIIK